MQHRLHDRRPQLRLLRRRVRLFAADELWHRQRRRLRQPCLRLQRYHVQPGSGLSEARHDAELRSAVTLASGVEWRSSDDDGCLSLACYGNSLARIHERACDFLGMELRAVAETFCIVVARCNSLAVQQPQRNIVARCNNLNATFKDPRTHECCFTLTAVYRSFEKESVSDT